MPDQPVIMPIQYLELEVLEIPDDVDWGIYDYDGAEFIYDKNRVWGL